MTRRSGGVVVHVRSGGDIGGQARGCVSYNLCEGSDVSGCRAAATANEVNQAATDIVVSGRVTQACRTRDIVTCCDWRSADGTDSK